MKESRKEEECSDQKIKENGKQGEHCGRFDVEPNDKKYSVFICL